MLPAAQPAFIARRGALSLGGIMRIAKPFVSVKPIHLATLVVVQRHARKSTAIEKLVRIGPMSLHVAIENNWIDDDKGKVSVTIELADGAHVGCLVYKEGRRWVVKVPPGN